MKRATFLHPLRWSAALALLLAAPLGAQEAKPNPLDLLVKTLGRMESPAVQINILRGMNASLKGKRGLPAPAGWDELYAKLKTSADPEVRQQAQALAAIFGGGAVLEEMRKTLGDAQAPLEARRAALDSLVAARDAGALPLLLTLTAAPGPLRAPAIRALAGYDDARVAPTLLGGYASFDSAEKRDVLNTLLSRAATAHALLAGIDAGTVERAAITAPLARQLQSFKDAGIDAWMSKNWGAVRTSSADKQAQIAKIKEFLTTDLILKADASRGRALFAQTCGVCHVMFGVGGKVGPELPGAFEDIDYLLQNIVDPNAIIGKDYQQTFVTLKDGQVVSGIVTADDPGAMTLKTLGDSITVQRGDIREVKISEQSMMPEGLLSVMDEESVRDLFAYLRQRRQVPMLATAMNANDFFNGTDLTRWAASSGAWKVENGELVGQGKANGVASLTSEIIAKDFTLSAEVKVSGAQAVAELVLAGTAGGGKFAGRALSIGGSAPANLWDYSETPPKPFILPGATPFNEWTKLEVTRRGAKLVVKAGAAPAVEFDVPANRTGPAIFLRGEGSEVRVRGLKLSVTE